MDKLVTFSCSKVALKYNCKFCDYNTDKKSSFDKHLHTKKHNVTLCDKKSCSKVAKYECQNCNKKYVSRNGLWSHNKKCKKINNNTKKDDTSEQKDTINAPSFDKDELIMVLVKQNTELIKEQNDIKNIMIEHQNLMMKVIENGTNNTINSNNTNSNNKAFNLNFFLNETCKDAMNITDFINSIKLQLSDLENIGEVGYVKGISNIITSNLKALDITQRPIHCTDKKRETLYIKDENKWEKEDENKNKLRKAIKKVANKNILLIQEFKKKHPDCIKSTSRFSDKYNKIIIEAMGGQGDNDIEKEDKIIKNISDITTLDKNEGI